MMDSNPTLGSEDDFDAVVDALPGEWDPDSDDWNTEVEFVEKLSMLKPSATVSDSVSKQWIRFTGKVVAQEGTRLKSSGIQGSKQQRLIVPGWAYFEASLGC